MRPPVKKQGYPVVNNGGAVKVDRLPLLFAGLVAPGSRRFVSPPLSRLRCTSAPAQGGALIARRFQRARRGRVEFPYYTISDSEKGKTKASRRGVSCFFAAAMVSGKYPPAQIPA